MFMPMFLYAVLSFSGLIEEGAVSLNSMCSMLDTVNRCVPIFKATETLQNLRMAHGLPLKGSCDHFISFSSHLLRSAYNLMHTCCFFTLGHHEYDMTQKLLIILDDCIRLIDCSEFLLRGHAGAWLNVFVPSSS
jgi:hypothetical protein